MALLLIPATRENLEKSIEQSVDIEFAKQYLGADFVSELLRFSGNEGVRCWAVTKNRKKLFDQISAGDEVLLTEKGTGLFTHYGVVVAKTRNRSFGENLWPFAGEHPWEYIYFLANIRHIEIEKSDFVLSLGYQKTYTVPGSVMVSSDKYGVDRALFEQLEIPVCDYVLEAQGDCDYSADNVQSIATRRIGHAAFSKKVKVNYGYACAICGIQESEFLVSGHITPWSEDTENRLNPANGICLCSLHDKAFEHGYISLDDDFRVIVSDRLDRKSVLFSKLEPYLGKQIGLPKASPPGEMFLEIHRRRHRLVS